MNFFTDNNSHADDNSGCHSSDSKSQFSEEERQANLKYFDELVATIEPIRFEPSARLMFSGDVGSDPSSNVSQHAVECASMNQQVGSSGAGNNSSIVNSSLASARISHHTDMELAEAMGAFVAQGSHEQAMNDQAGPCLSELARTQRVPDTSLCDRCIACMCKMPHTELPLRTMPQAPLSLSGRRWSSLPANLTASASQQVQSRASIVSTLGMQSSHESAARNANFARAPSRIPAAAATKANERQLLPESFTPHGHSVFLGRGQIIHKSEGNVKLAKLVKSRLKGYSEATSMQQKSAIVTDIVHSVRLRANHEGAFIRVDNNQRYWEASDKDAREKVGSVFRNFLKDSYRTSSFNRTAKRREIRMKREKQSKSRMVLAAQRSMDCASVSSQEDNTSTSTVPMRTSLLDFFDRSCNESVAKSI